MGTRLHAGEPEMTHLFGAGSGHSLQQVAERESRSQHDPCTHEGGEHRPSTRDEGAQGLEERQAAVHLHRQDRAIQVGREEYLFCAV